MNLIRIIQRNYLQFLCVFLAFLLMVIVSYISVSRVLEGQLKANAEKELAVAEANIRANFMEPKTTLMNTAFTIQNMMELHHSRKEISNYMIRIDKWLNTHKENIAGFNGIYGYIQNEYLDGRQWVPDEGYVVEKRPWYLVAKEAKGRIASTQPYMDAKTGVMVISFAQELFDSKKQPMGVLAVDIDVNNISDYVTSRQLTKGGYGIMLDNNFNIIAHPKQVFIGNPMSSLGVDASKLVRMARQAKKLQHLISSI